MRFLHTSDWHIGRTFHGVELLADQASALAAIAQIVADDRVDVVLVAGDVYDRSIPGADAIEVCHAGFEQIRAAGAQIVVSSGNHDSPTRLGAGGAFTAAGGLYLRTRVATVDVPVLLEDPYGPVACYGLPYLEPDLVRMELDAPQARSHAEVIQVAMARVRADVARRSGPRSIVLAHAFVQGGAASGSERSITVGGAMTVPVGVFEGIDYVALGHLHSPQRLTERVRYSGSPLPYSFGERSHRKAVWLIDFGATGVTVRRRDLPVVRGLSQLNGTLEHLLSSREFECARNNYVSVLLTDRARPVDALRRLRERFPHAVHVEWRRPESDSEASYRERVSGRGDLEIAAQFLREVFGEPGPDALEWIRRGLDAAAAPEVPAGAPVAADMEASA